MMTCSVAIIQAKLRKGFRVGPMAVLFLMAFLGPAASARYKDERTSILLAFPMDSDAKNGYSHKKYTTARFVVLECFSASMMHTRCKSGYLRNDAKAKDPLSSPHSAAYFPETNS